MKNNLYVKIAAQPKVTGLAYKSEVQITAYALNLVKDFS